MAAAFLKKAILLIMRIHAAIQNLSATVTTSFILASTDHHWTGGPY